MFRKVIAGAVVCLTLWTAIFFPPILTRSAIAEQTAAPELSYRLLDRWLALLSQVASHTVGPGNDAPLDTDARAEQVDQDLGEACRKAGFPSPAECSCISLYAAVLMTGYDRASHRFIDPATAAERRVKNVEARDNLSGADSDKLQRDRRMLSGLRKAFPAGIPIADLNLMGTYFRDRMPKDPAVWRSLANGLKAVETQLLADQCPLPGLTVQATQAAKARGGRAFDRPSR